MNRPGDERDEEYVVLNPIEVDRVTLNGPNTTKAADDEPRVVLNPTRPAAVRFQEDLKPLLDAVQREWSTAYDKEHALKALAKALRALQDSFSEASRYAKLLAKKHQGDTPDGGEGFKFPDAGDGKGAFKPRNPEDDRRTATNPHNDSARERQAALDARPVGAEDTTPIFGPSRRTKKRGPRVRLL